MKPTSTAKKLSRDLEAGFKTIYDAVDRLSKPQNNTELRIASLPSVASRIVLPRLGELRKLLPNAQLNFTYIHRIEDIHDWDADVLICAIDAAVADVGDAKVLFSGKAQPFASPDYIAENGPFRKPEDFVGAKLLHDFDTLAWRSWFKRAGLEARPAKEGYVFEDFQLMLHAALAHQGLALCPPALISSEIENGALQLVHNLAVNEDRNYVVLLAQGDNRNVAGAFAEWLLGVTEMPSCNSVNLSTLET